jgi:hypothetical protein
MLSKAAERVFDRLERGDVDVWKVINLYERSRDVHELEDVLVAKPHLATSILYIMSEISSNRITPVWRSAIPFLHSADLNCIFYALDIIHGAAGEANPQEILSALDNVHVSEKSIVNKVRTIRKNVIQNRSRL